MSVQSVLMSQTVFFDLDGTLTDPKIGITTSIQFALRKLVVEVPSKDELTWCIGPPLRDSFRVLVGDRRCEQAVELYRERFSAIGWQENSLYPGIVETLARLSDEGFRLFVATSKPHIFANKIIDHFQLRDYFDAVYGSELDGTRADKAELLQVALCEVKPVGKAVMIGDREHDVVAALANGMQPVGVSYGYGSSRELREAGALRIVSMPLDLLSELM